MRKIHPRYAALSLSAALIFGQGLLSGAKADEGTPQRGGTVILTLGADAPTVNPVVSTGAPDGTIGCILYQGLTTVTAGGEVAPRLAKSWTVSPDGKTYSFELNKASWQDGKPFTSEDVKYSLIQVNAKISPPFAASGRMIEGIDTPAPDKAVIHLKQPFGPFLMSLACGWGGAILPKHIYEGTNPAENPATTTSPVGLGAFILKEWKRGDYIRLVRNPNYWEPGKPYLDEIVAKIITQSAARGQALQAGEVDYVYYYWLSNSDHPAIEANAKLKLENAPMPPSLDYMEFNVKRKPVDDKRIRQALVIATDRDYILRTAWLGKGRVGTMPFASDIKWAINPDVDFRKMYPYDPARANALLDEAGMKRGPDGTRFKLHLVHAADESDNVVVGSALKSMWRAAGVDLEVESVERATQLKRVFQDHDFDVALNGVGSYYDPAVGLARVYATSGIGNLYANASNYSNPEIDELFRKAEGETTLADRGAVYRQIQALLAADMPSFPMREKGLFDGATKKLMGLQDDTDQYRSWNSVWLAK